MAEMFGSEVTRCASTAMPLSSVRPAACANADFWHDADADEDEIGQHAAAVGGGDAGGAAVCGIDGGDARLEQQAVAPGLMRLGEELRHDRRHGAAHAARQRLDHRHLLAELRGDGGELQPDKAGAGDDDALRARGTAP